jgi:hypothetical protein
MDGGDSSQVMSRLVAGHLATDLVMGRMAKLVVVGATTSMAYYFAASCCLMTILMVIFLF